MEVHIQGAREHNLKNIDGRFGDGLNAVTNEFDAKDVEKLMLTKMRSSSRTLMERE